MAQKEYSYFKGKKKTIEIRNVKEDLEKHRNIMGQTLNPVAPCMAYNAIIKLQQVCATLSYGLGICRPYGFLL